MNAIKFCNKDAGRVRLWVRYDETARELVVGVTDNGPGIAAENLQEIFERFRQVDGDFKANIKGFGLGLSISKQLAQLNLGQMTVESEEGEGSTFSFTLPPAEPVALIDRYLRTSVYIREVATFVSLVSVVADAEKSAAASLVDAFLLTETRHTDLVFGGEGRWLLAFAMADRDARRIVKRLDDARDRWNEKNPDEKLPPVRFRSLGTWRIGERNDDLERCFKTLWNGREVSRAIATMSAGQEDPGLDHP